jgi:3-oxoadipate enol-lactonase
MPFINCNGVSLYYVDQGAGDETLVFSHGLLMSHEMFHEQLDFFKSSYRCIAYDHRGQGKSEVTQTGYDMDSLYLDAAALIENLNVGAVHFIGLSMGGFVGMRLAARKPHLLKSLTLLETSADAEVYKLKYKLLSAVVKVAGTKPVHKKVMNILFGQTFLTDSERKDEVTHWTNHLLSRPRSITKCVDGVINRQPVYDELKSIAIPTLILVGDEDVATPPNKAERIHKQINGSILEVIEGAGHSSSIEVPEKVNFLLRKFLSNQTPKN